MRRFSSMCHEYNGSVCAVWDSTSRRFDRLQLSSRLACERVPARFASVLPRVNSDLSRRYRLYRDCSLRALSFAVGPGEFARFYELCIDLPEPRGNFGSSLRVQHAPVWCRASDNVGAKQAADLVGLRCPRVANAVAVPAIHCSSNLAPVTHRVIVISHDGCSRESRPSWDGNGTNSTGFNGIPAGWRHGFPCHRNFPFHRFRPHPLKFALNRCSPAHETRARPVRKIMRSPARPNLNTHKAGFS
jgi:hypothetical protein